MRKDALRNATILAAIAFLITVVATHLLFQPGAEMISAAYAPEIVNDKLPETGKAALANYASLRSANPALAERAALILRKLSAETEQAAVKEAAADPATPASTRSFLDEYLRRGGRPPAAPAGAGSE